MRTISERTEARFAREATTLCTCWRITREDGVEVGLTDHDEDVAFGGTLFRAEAGAAPTALRQTADLTPDDAEFESALSSEAITPEDLDAGRYDEAALQMWRVDWADPDARLLLRTGRIGEVTRAGEGYAATFRSLKGALETVTGRLYGRRCDAGIGDARCGLDLGATALDAAVLTGGAEAVTLDAGAPARPGLYDGGTLSVTSGALAGLAVPVRRAEAGVSGLVVTLWRALPQPLGTGDTARLTAGCDKRLATCRAFGNTLNFRGHPHMPGNDVLTATPSPGASSGASS